MNHGEIPARFFIDRRKDQTPGIELADDFFRLKESMQYANLPGEVESRWLLVETGWELRLPSRMLLDYNPTTEMLIARGNLLRRNDITACRDALNGYQKGRCFYCFGDISIGRGSPDLADVDHFVPRLLITEISGANLDGVWNLVLACRSCNRGTKGKSARLPKAQLLERLHTRNEYFTSSARFWHRWKLQASRKCLCFRLDFGVIGSICGKAARSRSPTPAVDGALESSGPVGRLAQLRLKA